MTYTDNYLNELRKGQSAIPHPERLDHSRILITGAGGLICSALVDLLLHRNDSAGAGIQFYAAGRSRE